MNLRMLLLCFSSAAGYGRVRRMKKLAPWILFTAVALHPEMALAQLDLRTALGRPVGGVSGINQGRELLGQNVDTDVFPNAVCNDGSPGRFYFRPYTGEPNRNRWLIVLMGGGFCADPESCARRWKRQDLLFSAFGANSMSTSNLPNATNGRGVLHRVSENPYGDAENPYGDWNHVLVHYCSSDRWTGTSLAPVTAYFPPVPISRFPPYDPEDPWVTRINPVTGQPFWLRLPFMGRRILEATLDTLRRRSDAGDGSDLPDVVYVGEAVRTTTPITLPDLDDAEVLVLAGGSAGGMGVINNLDHVAGRLRATNTGCGGTTPCAFPIMGIPDSVFGPQMQFMDLTQTPACTRLGHCTWDEQMSHSMTAGTHAMWGSAGDASCVQWHLGQNPAYVGRCGDEGYVLTNHVTTPFFVRMGQEDSLIFDAYQRLGVRMPNGRAINLPAFRALVRLQANALALLKTEANEHSEIAVVPGAFVPTCSDHDTLRQSTQVYDVTINVGQRVLAMFDVVRAWVLGFPDPNAIVVARNAGRSTCVR